MDYDNELVNEGNCYTDADLEAWLYDFPLLLISLANQKKNF